jgi:Flp pilus assembly protein TadG
MGTPGKIAGEAGGIVTGWLLRIVVVLLVLAAGVFEAGAVAVNTITVDDAAREVARVAALTYSGDRDLDAAFDAGTQAARERGVRLREVEVDGDRLSVTVESSAPTLLIHRLEPLAGFTVREATRTLDWR